MNGHKKSDDGIVPMKPANEAEAAADAEEQVEGRPSIERNSDQQNRLRTQSRESLQNALIRIRQAAESDKEAKFTALWHHVYNVDRLREAYFSLKRTAAPGIDGETWSDYGQSLEENLQDLSSRLQRGGYRARPVVRVMIPKADGKQRPIGVPVLEDKIVQRATVEVLNAIYETDFVNFSYGFRPNRSQHSALNALAVGITMKKVNWVLDADLRGFFDSIDHEWIVKFLEHRVADGRVIRHVKKWLNAGVLEKRRWSASEEGTPQGGSISPLLANIYLHYAFDLWVKSWRRRKARGDMIVVRYADDFIVGFEREEEAKLFVEQLRERLSKFKLTLHPEKTRLIEFGRYARGRRAKQGLGKPETFDFLGFTHICAEGREGRYRVLRKTRRKRMRAKLSELKEELRRRMHLSTNEVGAWLRRVVAGHNRYFGVPYNMPALAAFRYHVTCLWHRALSRRSQRARDLWKRVSRLAERWLPRPEIHHPLPTLELALTLTRDKSPVR